jgi:hypothetical protein
MKIPPSPMAMNRNSHRRLEAQKKRHPDCQTCQSAWDEVEQQIVATGVLRMEVIDLKMEMQRMRRAMHEHTDRSAVRRYLGEPRCRHRIVLSGRCTRCGRHEEIRHAID